MCRGWGTLKITRKGRKESDDDNEEQDGCDIRNFDVVLMVAGIGYAVWSKTLCIEGAVNMGELDVGFVAGWCDDEGVDLGYVKDVGWCSLDMSALDTVKSDVMELF